MAASWHNYRRDSMDFQAAVDAYCTIWVKDNHSRIALFKVLK
jgi:hypothetical protein